MSRILLWSLIAIVAIAPLPLRSNKPLGWSLLSLEVGILLIFWAVHPLWTGKALPVKVAGGDRSGGIGDGSGC